MLSRSRFPSEVYPLLDNHLTSFNSDGKESACSAGGPGLIPGSGRSRGEGKGCPLQFSGLENSMDRGAWWATVHEVAKNRTWLSDFSHI